MRSCFSLLYIDDVKAEKMWLAWNVLKNVAWGRCKNNAMMFFLSFALGIIIDFKTFFFFPSTKMSLG